MALSTNKRVGEESRGCNKEQMRNAMRPNALQCWGKTTPQ